MSSLDLVGSYYLGKQLRESSDAAAKAREDMAARRAVTADVAPETKPASSDNFVAAKFGLNGVDYDTQDQASAAARDYNAPDAKIARLQGVMLSQADTAGAMGLEKANLDMKAVRQRAAKTFQDEGINQFIDTNLGGAPSVADIEAKKAGLFDLQGVPDFNKTGGKVTIPDGAKGRWKVMDYGNGRKEADFEVVGADGQPVAPMTARTLQAIHAMSAHEREQQADQRYQQGLTNARADREVDAKSAYLRSLADRADRYVPGGKGGGSNFERMNEADRLEYNAAVRRAAAIDDAIIKANADGTWDPSKNPSQLALLQQKEMHDRSARGILSKYDDQGASSSVKSDPYGIRGRIGDGGGKSPDADRSAILKSEYSKAIAARDAAPPGSPEWTRAQGDVQSLANEMRSLGAAAAQPASQASKGIVPAAPPKVTTQKLDELAAAAGIKRVPGPRGTATYIRGVGDGRRQAEMTREELARYLKVPY